MSQFVAALHQPGGCDYTIDCGTQVLSLKATTLEEAWKEIRELLRESYSGERRLDGVRVLEVVQCVAYPVKQVYAELEAESWEEEEKRAKTRRQEQFERL